MPTWLRLLHLWLATPTFSRIPFLAACELPSPDQNSTSFQTLQSWLLDDLQLPPPSGCGLATRAFTQSSASSQPAALSPPTAAFATPCPTLLPFGPSLLAPPPRSCVTTLTRAVATASELRQPWSRTLWTTCATTPPQSSVLCTLCGKSRHHHSHKWYGRTLAVCV